jgi:cbb3-type cytochrome c oxidase subunit III
MPARVTLLLAAFLAVSAPVYGQTPSGGGAGVATPALIARGDSVFHGPGNCYACHGSKAEGLVGPSLVDAEWIHSKGTMEEIAEQVATGIPKERSKSGIPMPAKGGSTISDDDVKAVAAYVHSLSQKKPGT